MYVFTYVCVCSYISQYYYVGRQAVAQDSFYNSGGPIRKAVSTVSRLHLIPPEDIKKLETLYENVQRSRTALVDMVSCRFHSSFFHFRSWW